MIKHEIHVRKNEYSKKFSGFHKFTGEEFFVFTDLSSICGHQAFHHILSKNKSATAAQLFLFFFFFLAHVQTPDVLGSEFIATAQTETYILSKP